MSIATVRGAIAAYLNTAAASGSQQIPTLNQVYRAMPTWIDPARWWQLPSSVPAGTVGFLHVARVDEDRVAFPAVEGVKLVGYTVVLMLLYKYLIPSATQGTQYEGDEWVDELDACVEGVKALIRADPNLGTAYNDPHPPGVIYSQFPGAIWQAGQDKGDLSQSSDLPARDEDAGEVISFVSLEFHAYEVITA